MKEEDFKDMYKLNESKVQQINVYNAKNFGQMLYGRKFGCDFMKEMNDGLNKAVESWMKKMDEF